MKPGTLQKLFAADITQRTHGEGELQRCISTSETVFGNSTEALRTLLEQDWIDLYDSLPNPEKASAKPHPEFGVAGVSKHQIQEGIPITKLLWWCGFLSSANEAKRAVREGSISINKCKVQNEESTTSGNQLIFGMYLLLQRGKKNYFLVKVV